MGNFNNPWGSSGNIWPPAWSGDSEELAQKNSGSIIWPSVTKWVVKTDGTTANDNNCPDCPKALGIDTDPVPSIFANGIEMQVFVKDDAPQFSYNIRRYALKVVAWERDPLGKWHQTGTRKKRFDDRTDNDEDLNRHPDGNLVYFYSTDRPAISKTRPNDRANSDKVVFIMNFEEYMRIDTIVNGKNKYKVDKNMLLWHSKFVIDKQSNGTWLPNKAESSIGKGKLSLSSPSK